VDEKPDGFAGQIAHGFVLRDVASVGHVAESKIIPVES
jgi:hypothetical protein